MKIGTRLASSENGTFYRLITSDKKHIELGIFHTSKKKVILSIMLKKKFTTNQINNFLKKEEGKIKALSEEVLKLAESPIKVGKKRKVDPDLALFLYKNGWKPKKIDEFFTKFLGKNDNKGEINIISITQAIQRAKKKLRNTKT